MSRHGFSLIELLVVIAIIAIILSIAIPNYGRMVRQRGIERQTRELLADISSFRLSAAHNKERRAILIGPTRLQFKRYANNTEDLFAGGVVLWEKNMSYEIQRGTDAGDPLQPFNINADVIEFDMRGYTINNTVIVTLPVDEGGSNNCLRVHIARINIGRMTNATMCQAL